MKSKKSLYLLLSAVIIIWGLIIYRVIANVSFSTDLPQSFGGTNQAVDEQIELDSFTIQANYRDPFLEKERKTEPVKPVVNNNAIKKPVVEKPVVTMIEKPKYSIRYKGLIANQASKTSLAMMSIDGKELMMRKKDIYKDLTILNISKDSVLIGSPNGNFYVKRK